MVEIFSESHKTLKVAKNLQFICCWSIFFCISEELTETNVQGQFRVIPSFKFHNWKGFYSANCPGVTQKLAHLSPVTHQNIYFQKLDKVVELVGGGSIIIGAYPV